MISRFTDLTYRLLLEIFEIFNFHSPSINFVKGGKAQGPQHRITIHNGALLDAHKNLTFPSSHKLTRKCLQNAINYCAQKARINISRVDYERARSS